MSCCKFCLLCSTSVSYTHLDVYKRQLQPCRNPGKSIIQTLDIARSTGADGHPVGHLAFQPVSYTHLDVYKRQDISSISTTSSCKRLSCAFRYSKSPFSSGLIRSSLAQHWTLFHNSVFTAQGWSRSRSWRVFQKPICCITFRQKRRCI